MHTIEFDGGPWRVTTDTGETWHAPGELEAVASLAEFVLDRHHADQRVPALPEGASWV
jgi:hypothetical protein